MEAKDTVKFKLEEFNKLPYMGSLNEDVIKMLEAQAEISFKAGFFKVMAWIALNTTVSWQTDTTSGRLCAVLQFRDSQWQAFLKEVRK